MKQLKCLHSKGNNQQSNTIHSLRGERNICVSQTLSSESHLPGVKQLIIQLRNS